nr:glycosyltransferase family 4 protein [Deinococcus peraridilitoris]
MVLTGHPNYPEGTFAAGYGRGVRRETFCGARVSRVPMLARGAGGARSLALNYLSFALAASLLGPLLCRGRFDIIFVYEPSPMTVGFPAIVLRFLRRTPLVFWVQDLWPESLSATGFVTSPIILASVERMVRWIYRHCDLILVTSRAFIPSVQRVGRRYDGVAYYPQSAEVLYRPMRVEEAPDVGAELPKGFRVMFAGNLGTAQDLPTVLAAAELVRDLPDIRWILIGDGSMRSWVETEIERRGLQEQVHLVGRRPVSDMPKYFAHADALLVTLKRDPIFALTVPAKLQSYLACARPIIAALEGEGASIVREARAGLTVSPQDPVSLAQSVRKMYAMGKNEREQYGVRGRIYFLEHFERERLLDELERHFAAVQRQKRRQQGEHES